MARYALILAANRFADPSISPLRYAEQDARLMEGFLREAAGFDVVRSLYGNDLRKDTALKIARELAARLSRAGGGLLLIFYAGHGYRHNGKDLFLCPEARLHDLDEFDHAISADRLKQGTNQPSVDRLLITDSCRTGLHAGRRQAAIEGFDSTGLRNLVGASEPSGTAGSWSHVAACDDNEQACEIEEIEHGAFCYSVVATLRNAKTAGYELRVDELFMTELRSHLDDILKKHRPKTKQQPWYLVGGGRAPVILPGSPRPAQHRSDEPQGTPPNAPSAGGSSRKTAPARAGSVSAPAANTSAENSSTKPSTPGPLLRPWHAAVLGILVLGIAGGGWVAKQKQELGAKISETRSAIESANSIETLFLLESLNIRTLRLIEALPSVQRAQLVKEWNAANEQARKRIGTRLQADAIQKLGKIDPSTSAEELKNAIEECGRPLEALPAELREDFDRWTARLQDVAAVWAKLARCNEYTPLALVDSISSDLARGLNGFEPRTLQRANELAGEKRRLIAHRAARLAVDRVLSEVTALDDSAPETDLDQIVANLEETMRDLTSSEQSSAREEVARKRRSQQKAFAMGLRDQAARTAEATHRARILEAAEALLRRVSDAETRAILLQLIRDSKSSGAQRFVVPAPGDGTTVAAAKPWTNSLGMRFVSVPLTHVLFGIWEVGIVPVQPSVNPPPTGGGPGPQGGVSWMEAKRFCEALTEAERRLGYISNRQRYRLPYDSEWSMAVDLPVEPGATPQQRHLARNSTFATHFPWGRSEGQPPSSGGNYSPRLFIDDFPGLAPPGRFTGNQYGIFDLGGNLWEWCEDSIDGATGNKVLRGGSYRTEDVDEMRSAYRLDRPADSHQADIGFRLVLAND